MVSKHAGFVVAYDPREKRYEVYAAGHPRRGQPVARGARVGSSRSYEGASRLVRRAMERRGAASMTVTWEVDG